MQYRTITHELLLTRPDLATRLASDRQLLPTVLRLADALQQRHLWLQTQFPHSHPQTARSEALERAVEDLTRAVELLSPTPSGEWEPTLEQAAAFLRPPTPPA